MKKYLKINEILFLTLLLFSILSRAAVIDITSAPYNATTTAADNSTSIQAAITAAGNGDTVLVPAGIFLSGPITLKSNLNFEIAAGATLMMLAYGSFPDTSDFISGSNLTNISITGAGTLDGQGQAWWTAYNADNSISRPPAMIYLSSCTGVTLTGIAVQDSPEFHIQLLGNCVNVYASGLSITAAWPSPNTDGIDLRGNSITIESCYISDGDDVIQIGGSNPTSNVTIRNCTFGTGHGLSIGSYTDGGVNNVLVDNCTFNGTQYGIRWKSETGRGGTCTNLTYTNITMTGILAYPFYLTSYYPDNLPPSSDTWVTPTSTTPYWNNITLQNITASTASGASGPGIMWALPEAPMTNILLDNVNVTGPSGVNFEFHHATGVTITCTCRVDGSQPPANIGAFDADIYYPACVTTTATQTPANTNTRTPTIIRTPTPSASATMTASPTKTTSSTCTITATFTVTPTPTSAITLTGTGTESPTISKTTTLTATSPATGTQTKTNTITNTTTFTVTRIDTMTNTATTTLTATDTPQNTATMTKSATNTITPTSSVTDSPVISETATYTAVIFTCTNTPIYTASPTDTITCSATTTVTKTNTSTVTMTQTTTGTDTFTPAISATPTYTGTIVTLTCTITKTSTATMTPSCTSTGTQTSTKTITPTYSMTETPSRTVTDTLTVTPVNSSTPTCTNTIDIALTATATTEQVQNTSTITTLAYPDPYNPMSNGNLNLKFTTGQELQSITIKIYTAAFRLVKDITWEGDCAAGNIYEQISAAELMNLASGTYYLRTTAGTAEGKRLTEKAITIIILK